MRKIAFALAALLIAVNLSGCAANQTSGENSNAVAADGARETGTVIDLAAKNNQSVQAKVGDVLYIKLTGKAASGFQWFAISPTSDGWVMLKDHVVVGLNDPNAPNGEFTDEWWLKVEKAGSFTIQFDYSKPNKKAEQSFKVSVVSQ